VTVLPLAAAAHRHGLRLVLLVVVVVVVVVAIVEYRRSHRPTPDDGPLSPSGAGADPVDAADPGIPPVAAAAAAPGAAVAVTPRHRAGVPPIRADGLTKRYGEQLAVDRLTFDVAAGQVTGFLGPNGAGKSTTMRMIMGLDRSDGGSVTVHGRRYHDLSWPLHEVGALLEASALHPGRSASAHLWMLARTHGIPRRRVDEVLHLVGLAAVARRRVGGFSMGMRQRLGIAAALLGDPGILLFDEPVNGLDTDGIRWVRGLVRSLADEGRTVFVSSHLMSEMALMADHVVVIGKGRLLADQSTDEFTGRFSHRSVRVRSPHLETLVPVLEAAGASTVTEPDGSLTVEGLSADDVGELAWRNQVLLHELAPRSATLEEAFIESTEGELEFRGER